MSVMLILGILRVCLAMVCALAASTATVSAADAPPATLDSAISAAQQSHKPLFVIAGGESCPYCRQLNQELQKPDAQRELARWIVAKIDVDASPDDAMALAVRAIPALRLLTPAGKTVAAREGFLPADELIEWLSDHFEAASAALPPELTATGELTALQAVRLARQLGGRDPTVREAAIRKLSGNRAVAAPPVANAFVEGSLSSRLAALDILTAWKAPVEGLDPWQPNTITQERLEALSAWSVNPQVATSGDSITSLSDSLTSSAQASLDRMLAGSAAEAAAIRERLARHGRLLLPLVYERLRSAPSDEARERLIALRYRLAATDELALTWPGGIDRLAASDQRIRHQALDELAARATSADEPLLLELFSDPAPLVRELALQALYKTGGTKANSALSRLLDDPDPNVQVAALKQLAEAPAHAALPRLRSYIGKQSDADLLVHVVRVLRGTQSKASLESLVDLLQHENWRVRAEAAEAIGEVAGAYGAVTDEDKADGYVALVELLKDDDPFVVSRAVQVLAKANLAIAVNPLASVAERHPALAVEVVKALAHSSSAQLRVAEHLRRFAKSGDAKVRAAAITGLCQINPDGVETELQAALADSEEAVRVAAAGGLFEMMNAEFNRRRLEAMEAELASGGSGSLLGRGLAALGNWLKNGEKSESAASAKAPATNEAADEPIKLPPWMHALEPDLEKMFAASSRAERFAAALPLTALGEYAGGVPVLEEAVREDRARLAGVAVALHWLPWSERERLFHLLIDASRGTDDLTTVAQALVQRPSLRTTGLVWDLLARPDASGPLASSLTHALRQLYLGDRWYDLERFPKQQLDAATSDIRSRAASGPGWQRLTALALLVSLDAAAAEQVATQLTGDNSLDADLRATAFRVLLFVAEKDVAQKEAIRAIQAGQADRLDAALALLARGREALAHLATDGLELSESPRAAFGAESSAEAIPIVPAGLSADDLRPLLEQDRPAVRANAGYLLCLLGEPDGLAPLLTHWKAHGRGDAELTKLVYRAIAALDDSQQVPILAEIYQTLAASEYSSEQEVSAFYWTIRSMTGPEILALRKRIRDEFGADVLQRNNPFNNAVPTSSF